jgi:putative DNA primase/helicase
MNNSCPNGELDSVIKQLNIDETLDSLKPDEHTLTKDADDIASGRLFSIVFGNVIRYNKTAKSYFYYDGRVWKIDEEGLISFHLTKLLQKRLYAYIARKETDVSKEYVKYVERLSSRQKREIMLKEAKDFDFVDSTMWDSRGELINLQNGVYNLETHEFLPHSPEYLLTKIANATYNPEAKSKDWEKFISEVTQSKDKERYLQVKFGYGMTTDTQEESMDIIYGRSTRNGKSTVLETISYTLGTYAQNVNPETLAQKPRDSRSPSEDVARLNGCRFLVCPEPPKRMVFDVARVKTFIGRDTLTARNLYEKSFEFVPCFKLFMNTNYLPVVTDDTLFSSGRVRVITFDRHFEENEQDKTLKDRLQTPENISGIFNWILEGLKIYQNEGIIVPECVKEATKEYRESQDKINQFISDTLEENPDGVMTITNVYPEYVKWCQNNGYFSEKKTLFIDELKTKGLWRNTGTVRGTTHRNVMVGYAFSDDLNTDKNPFTD